MTEPTPPPERPMSDEARARIRGELLGHAHDNRSTAPRWLVPAGAAAAVALVASLAFWAVGAGGADTVDTGDTPVTGGDTSSAPVTPSLPEHVETGSGIPTLPGPTGAIQVGTRSCEEEMEYVLRDATLALQFDDTSSFWVKGEKFVLCDELDGRTTVHRPLPLTPRDDVSTYAVSTDVLEGQTIRSAGGLVPAGAEEVFDAAYTFPDGHTERATTATDDQGRTWWRMTYTFRDSRESELATPGIGVTMSLSGVQKEYTLAWGIDTCAQANHGC